MINIYLIKNRENGKRYVGQTKRPAVARFCQHIESAFRLSENKRNCFYKEICESGENALETFSCEIIEVCDESSACERERYWIEELKCEYNENFKMSYIKSLSSNIVQEYNSGKTMQQLSQKYRCRHTTIREILIDNGVKLNKNQGRSYKKVYEFNDLGEMINIFENAGACSSETGIDGGNIRLCASCNYKTQTISRSAEGRHFSYSDKPPQDLFVISKNGETYNFKTTNEIKSFLKNEWGEKSKLAHIKRAYKSKKRKTVYGYKVEFIHDILMRRNGM